MMRRLRNLIVFFVLAFAAGMLALGAYLFIDSSGLLDEPTPTAPPQVAQRPTATVRPTQIIAMSGATETPGACPANGAVDINAESLNAPRPNNPPNVSVQAQSLPRSEPRRVNPPGQAKRDQVMIRFTENSTQQQRNEYIRQINGRSRRQIDKLNTYVVVVPANTDTSNLPASPIVEVIEPDYYVSPAQTDPNDTHYVEQWALPLMNVPAVWSAIPAGGSPVIVAVIDSGVCLDHPDLSGRMVGGYDFVQDDTTPQDEFGHGCGVAGVIAANAANGVGIAGVAPNAQIMPLRVLDNRGLGNYSDVSAAIVYAADNGAHIINLSLAGPNPATVLEEAIMYAVERGVIVIAASGNSGLDTVWYPAAYESVVAVGSVNQSLSRSTFSNYSSTIDLMAPGESIYTTGLNGTYTTMTGTSFAAPQVAGVMALARAFDRNLTYDGGVVYIAPPGRGC